jgi:hypothetical protein
MLNSEKGCRLRVSGTDKPQTEGKVAQRGRRSGPDVRGTDSGKLICILLMLILTPYCVLMMVAVGPLAVTPLLSMLGAFMH